MGYYFVVVDEINNDLLRFNANGTIAVFSWERIIEIAGRTPHDLRSAIVIRLCEVARRARDNFIESSPDEDCISNTTRAIIGMTTNLTARTTTGEMLLGLSEDDYVWEVNWSLLRNEFTCETKAPPDEHAKYGLYRLFLAARDNFPAREISEVRSPHH